MKLRACAICLGPNPSYFFGTNVPIQWANDYWLWRGQGAFPRLNIQMPWNIRCAIARILHLIIANAWFPGPRFFQEEKTNDQKDLHHWPKACIRAWHQQHESSTIGTHFLRAPMSAMVLLLKTVPRILLWNAIPLSRSRMLTSAARLWRRAFGSKPDAAAAMPKPNHEIKFIEAAACKPDRELYLWVMLEPLLIWIATRARTWWNTLGWSQSPIHVESTARVRTWWNTEVKRHDHQHLCQSPVRHWTDCVILDIDEDALCLFPIVSNIGSVVHSSSLSDCSCSAFVSPNRLRVKTK